jgi:MerR family transcriptional regulator, light-induced transcriptional regulator
MTKDKSTLSENIIDHLDQFQSEIARTVTEQQFARHPELHDRYGEAGKIKYKKIIEHHLRYLVEAVKLDYPALFDDYLVWSRDYLEWRGYTESDLKQQMLMTIQVLDDHYSGPQLDEITGVIRNAMTLRNVDQLSSDESYIRPDNPYAKESQAYLKALLNRDRESAARIISQLVEKNTPIEEIYEQIFQVTQYEVGRLWQRNEVSVGQEHYCTAATQQIMSTLYPKIFSTEKSGKKMTACSVSGELHEIGIRMVADLFELRGWDTDYLGANMPEEEILTWIENHKPHLLAISVTLPVHLSKARHLIELIRRNSTSSGLKILAGGYLFSKDPDLWKKVGADASASSAKEAVDLADSMVNV